MSNNITREIARIAEDLGIDRKRSIGEVAKELKVKTHVIRFWEENFPQVKPEIGKGKRRYYYNKQLKVLRRIKKFLYEEGYTITGLKKLLNKRVQNKYKEEDLGIIAGDAKENSKATIDNFIDPEVNIKTNLEIKPDTKLFDFAKIKVSKIDPRIKQNIGKHLQQAKQNLSSLKSLLNNL